MFPATLTRARHGHVRRVLIVALAALLTYATLAIGPTVEAAVDQPYPGGPDKNSVTDWCEFGGFKDESPGYPYVVPAPSSVASVPAGATWSLLVLKSGNEGTSVDHENYLWDNPIPGVGYEHPEKDSNSHSILCWEPGPEPEAAQLTLLKTVSGGTAVVSDFPLFISGVPATSGVKYSLDPGDYTASETPQADYVAGNWGGDCAADGSVTLAADDDKTCTITNTFKESDTPPQLKLVKVVRNGNGGKAVPGDWDLTATGDGKGFTDSGDSTIGVFHEVTAGQAYALSETALDGYSQHSSGWSCDGGEQTGASVILNVGDSVTCTVANNDQKPSLTLIKEVVGQASPSEWTLKAVGPQGAEPAGFSGPGPIVVSPSSLDQGTYTLSESDGPDGYAASEWSCEGGIQDGDQITVGLGESATCTIINTEESSPPGPEYKITFVKRVCDDYGDIRANQNPSNIDESLGDLGDIVGWGVVNPTNEGEPCVPKSGWSFSMGTGYSSGGSPTNLSYATNAYGTSIVTEGSTPLLDAYGNPTGGSIAGAVTITLTDEQVKQAQTSRLWISEKLTGGELPNGYGFGIIRCDTDILNGDNVEFLRFDAPQVDDLREAAVAPVVTHKYCYAYNVAPDEPEDSSLTIVKKTINRNGTFEFESKSLGDFEIATSSLTGMEKFTELAAGTYTVAEDLDELGSRWSFEGVKCDAEEQDLNQKKATATVYLGAGDHVTCTFTNKYTRETTDPDEPDIDIEKLTNGEQSDSAPGEEIAVGEPIVWTYIVTNTGDVTLSKVAVTDDQGETVDCPEDTLASGAQMTCTATGTAELGLYANVGSVTGSYNGGTVSDTDPSHYNGILLEVGGTAQLGDTVWLDADNDGVQDVGEVGYNGAKVILTDADGNVVGTLTTSGPDPWDGFYKFVGLDAGTYTATLDLTTIGTYTVTTAKAFTVTLEEGDDFPDADFGLYEAPPPTTTTTTTTPPDETLPKTGADTEGIALLGLGLLMLGALAILATRRRRTED